MLIEKFNIPEWAMLYLVNDNDYGLTEDEKAMAGKWWKENRVIEVMWPEHEIDGHYSEHPAFGEPCDVFECECAVLDDEPRMTWEDEQYYHS